MSIVKVSPGFVIRGINSRDILTKYANGGYKDVRLKIQDHPKNETVRVAPINIVPINGSKPQDSLYVYRDRFDQLRINVFSNQEEFENSADSTEREKECHYCLDKFKHDPLRIPVSKIIYTIHNIKTAVYFGLGVYCDEHCAFSSLIESQALDHKFRDIGLKMSEIYLREIFKMRCPNKVLTRANDKRLLKRFGGSLEYGEWRTNTYRHEKDTYIRPSVGLIPIKGVYQKVTF